jgi:chemotaxis protein methyltransferase CheR
MPELFANPEEAVRPLSDKEFELIRRLARDTFGLDLRKGKEQMIGARLSKVIRGLQLKSFEEYHNYVTRDRSGQALVAMIDALTTNFTSFFREPAHFDLLRTKVLPELKGKSRIRFWSAGCSTGEEPYSLAICVAEALPGASLEIVATDISSRVLDQAASGLYAAERLESLSPTLLQRYFLRGQGRWAGWYRVKPAIRNQVNFERLNLVEQFTSFGKFDVIACRNVMIYFDKALQQDVVLRFAAQLERGGYLLIGHSETLNGMNHGLQYVAPAVYRKLGNR